MGFEIPKMVIFGKSWVSELRWCMVRSGRVEIVCLAAASFLVPILLGIFTGFMKSKIWHREGYLQNKWKMVLVSSC